MEKKKKEGRKVKWRFSVLSLSCFLFESPDPSWPCFIERVTRSLTDPGAWRPDGHMTTEAEQSTNEDKSTEKPAITGWLAHERKTKGGLCIPLYAHFLCSSQFRDYTYSPLKPTELAFFFFSSSSPFRSPPRTEEI